MRRSHFFVTWIIYSVVFLVQWALWLAFTDSTGYREICAGFIAAAVATTAVAIYSWKGGVSFRFRLVDVLQVWRLPGGVIADTVRIFRAVVVRLSGGTLQSGHKAVAYDVGKDDPCGAGRRALAVTYTTITPNTIVLGIVQEQGLLLYHQLVPDQTPEIIRHLGARP